MSLNKLGPNYRFVILNMFMNSIFSGTEKELNSQIDKFIIENNKLNPSKPRACAFKFKSEMYFHSRNVSADVSFLHRSLKPKFRILLVDIDENKLTKSKVRSFFSSALNICKLDYHVHSLMPEEIATIVSPIFVAVPPHQEIETLSQKDILAFRTEHKEVIELIKEKMVLNILLR